ncbi:hypothetical protein P691DRAFT_784142 [Macrolepiota fuliginosa MF-IS2]|uniref:SAP domain-containing protein n=1 Tax=Macrolepiota fuliginosa MF-IS2 TaxID=1400762 RepID=A0A9P5WX68_9AGAR|nr:hypothetical protein P691DRAFT_784142 [Macrolepiota fuliginosa MF-IS2]
MWIVTTGTQLQCQAFAFQDPKLPSVIRLAVSEDKAIRYAKGQHLGIKLKASDYVLVQHLPITLPDSLTAIHPTGLTREGGPWSPLNAYQSAVIAIGGSDVPASLILQPDTTTTTAQVFTQRLAMLSSTAMDIATSSGVTTPVPGPLNTYDIGWITAFAVVGLITFLGISLLHTTMSLPGPHDGFNLKLSPEAILLPVGPIENSECTVIKTTIQTKTHAELKELCCCCDLPVSGSKAVLSDHLHALSTKPDEWKDCFSVGAQKTHHGPQAGSQKTALKASTK